MELFAPALRQADLYLLALTRVLGLFATAPLLSNRLVPAAFRGAAAALVAAAVLPALTATPPGVAGLPQLAWLAAGELAVGMSIGFAATLVFAAVQLGGELLDIDLGFALASVLDPSGTTALPLIGNLKHLLAMLLFLGLNGHHHLLRTVAASYRVVPLGGLGPGLAAQGQLTAMAGALFSGAVALVAPAMAALLLTSVALALISRAVPQMNVFISGMPVKIIAGLAAVALTLPLFGAVLQRLLLSAQSDLEHFVRLLGG